MTDIVYKACGEYIVELKRLSDTITNEKRDGVVDRNYAKFRGNKFFVHSIKHKITNDHLSEIENTVFSDKIIKYIVGEEISTEFCENLNKICAEGIHFFRSFDAAYYYLNNIRNGIYKEYADNGQLVTKCNYKDNELNGEYNGFHENGKKSIICNYKDGELDGEYSECHKNGQLIVHCKYKNDLLDGEYSKWYDDGKTIKKM